MKTISISLVFLLGAAAAGAQTTASGQPVGTSGSAGAPAAGRANAATPAADYRLVPGDKLRVEVYKDAQLSQSVQVRPDGKITLPLVNDIAAAGQTATELRDAIVSSLKTYMSSPTVTVMVVETVPPQVFVIGEVNAPGAQPLSGRLNAIQALALAKGFTDFANTKSIIIQRGDKVLTFNYNDAIRGKTAAPLLQPNDTIVVK
jgi:polysaccharide biosynthesis/export protein